MNRLKHQEPGLPGGCYKPLKETEVPKVAEAALRILEKSGVAVYSPTARDAFLANGATIDPDSLVVKLPRGMVEDAVASAPSSVTLASRDNKHDVVLEQNRVHYGTGGTAIYVLDPETGRRRPSTLADVSLNGKLADKLENVHLFTINVFPNDIKEKDEIDVNRFFSSLDNTTKHVMGGIYSLEGCRQVVRMAEIIAGGPDRLRARPFVSFITLIISPFKIDQEYGEMTCFLARKELPVVVPTEPICGTTSPITLAGNVLTHTAETLAGITLVQCVKRGAPAIAGSVGSTCELSTMNHLGGPVERAMINAAVAQMAQYFQLPLYSTAGASDALEVDIQAAYESALSNLLVAMSGANYIHDALGLMEADLTVSYEKMVMDNEILGMCQRVLRGIEVTDETLAADLIIAKGPGDNYLTEEHTVRHMRSEFFLPRLANRAKRAPGKETPNPLEKARDFVRRVQQEPAPGYLDEAMKQRLRKEFNGLK